MGTTSATPDLGAALSFEEFFAAESQQLFRRMWLVTGNRAESEEITQDAFLALWERWDRVAALEDPTGYLYRTAMNMFKKRYRRAVLAARRVVRPSLRADDFAAADDRAVVRHALGELTPRQRAALVLTGILSFTSEEAGDMLGIRPGTVRTLASQGRAAFRQLLEADDA
jgi:RNA polymerase sigma factor (sigma-70 family)